MKTKVEIENFRGIRHGVLEPLAPLAVIVGANNSEDESVAIAAI